MKRINLTGAMQGIEKAGILQGVRSFTFRTRRGELRRYVRTEEGWLKEWNGVIEKDELVVKLVFIASKGKGDLINIERSGER